MGRRLQNQNPYQSGGRMTNKSFPSIEKKKKNLQMLNLKRLNWYIGQLRDQELFIELSSLWALEDVNNGIFGIIRTVVPKQQICIGKVGRKQKLLYGKWLSSKKFSLQQYGQVN